MAHEDFDMIEKCILLKSMVLHAVMLAPLILVGQEIQKHVLNAQYSKCVVHTSKMRIIPSKAKQNGFVVICEWNLKWRTCCNKYTVENFNYYSCNEYRHLNRLLHFARASSVFHSYGMQSHTTNIHANCEWRLNE